METRPNLSLCALPPQLLVPTRLVALAAPDHSLHPLVIRSLAAQAGRGEPSGVIVGHNSFDLHALTRLARHHGFDPYILLSRIRISRAFTCHQLHRLILTLDRASPQSCRALYVLGLLDTFYDESVRFDEAARLLNESLQELKRIARASLPVLISVSAPREPGRESLIKIVARATDEYWELAGPPRLAAPRQMEMPLGA